MKSLFSKYILLILFSTLFVCVSYSQWSNGQDATMVLGQADFVSTKKGTTDRNFSGPTHVVVDSKHQKLYVFEEINNRILRFSIPNGGFNSNQPVAEAVFGQVDMVSNKLGITSASTFLSPLGGDIDEDRDILWVADGTANRVLAFYNASFKQNGASADIVLGQKDFVSNQIYAGAGFNPSAEGMNHPSGVAVDKATHDIYITEVGRILSFKNGNQRNFAPANQVFGQKDFLNLNFGCTANQFGYTLKGICIRNNSLFVGDMGNHRILRFDNIKNIQQNMPDADMVFGQKDFMSNIKANSYAPDGYSIGDIDALTVDNSGLLYFSDHSLRIVIFPYAFMKFNGTAPGATNVLGQPDLVSSKWNNILSSRTISVNYGLAFDEQNGNLYVNDWGANRILQFKKGPFNPCVPVFVTITTQTDRICPGNPATFIANPINGGMNPSYQWKINGVDVMNNNGPVLTTNVLQDKDQVLCLMTSNEKGWCLKNNPAYSNQIVITSSKPDVSIGNYPNRLVGETIAANDEDNLAKVNIFSNDYNFQWQDGSTNNYYKIIKPGANDYIITAQHKKDGCKAESHATIVSYCNGKGVTHERDYIEELIVENRNYDVLFNFRTGNNNGFMDYAHGGGSAHFVLMKGQRHFISIIPNAVLNNQQLYYQVWIDYDHNGLFENKDVLGLNEQVLKNTMIVGPIYLQNFVVPLGAMNGITRMRVAMGTNKFPQPCDNGAAGIELNDQLNGEIEDYAVNLEVNSIGSGPVKFSSVKAVSADNLLNASKVSLSPNPFSQQTVLKINNIEANENYYTLEVLDMVGRRVKQINNINTSTIEFNRENLSSGIYQYQLLKNKNIVASGKMMIQ